MSITEKSQFFNCPQASFSYTNFENSSIEQAIELAGGACVLARKLGISHQAVYAWVKSGWVPIRRARQIEELSGIPMTALLKPDLASLLNFEVTK